MAKTARTDTAKTPAKQEKKLVGENITFDLTLPWENLAKAYNSALERVAQHVEIPGFRKGKAPKPLVEEKVSKTKLYEEAAGTLLSQAYRAEIEKQGLKPVIDPEIQAKSMEEGKDWVFSVETAELPQVVLGDYKKAIEGVKAEKSEKKSGEESTHKHAQENDRLKPIFTKLLETAEVVVPELLLRSEVRQMISRLVHQLDHMKIQVEDYLKSISKTVEQLQQEYAASALATIQLELILAEIARDAKLTVEDSEVESFIQGIPNEDARKTNDTPAGRAQIRAMLIKQKTLKYLLSLTG